MNNNKENKRFIFRSPPFFIPHTTSSPLHSPDLDFSIYIFHSFFWPSKISMSLQISDITSSKNSACPVVVLPHIYTLPSFQTGCPFSRSLSYSEFETCIHSQISCISPLAFSMSGKQSDQADKSKWYEKIIS